MHSGSKIKAVFDKNIAYFSAWASNMASTGCDVFSDGLKMFLEIFP
jgi:hypothetical protein